MRGMSTVTHEMATGKTRVVSGRVPHEVADAFEADATELGMSPGKLLRQMLEGRYLLRAGAGKTDSRARNSDIVRLADE